MRKFNIFKNNEDFTLNIYTQFTVYMYIDIYYKIIEHNLHLFLHCEIRWKVSLKRQRQANSQGSRTPRHFIHVNVFWNTILAYHLFFNQWILPNYMNVASPMTMPKFLHIFQFILIELKRKACNRFTNI